MPECSGVSGEVYFHIHFPKSDVAAVGGGVFRECSIPHGIAVLARLAVQEAQLLQPFGEDVFARHWRVGGRKGASRQCVEDDRCTCI